MVALPTVHPPEAAAPVQPWLGTDASHILSGTQPVTSFGDRLYGTLEADGQQPKVAALATTREGEVLVLAVVGFDTSIAAALAKLHAGKGLVFQPGTEVLWTGTAKLARLGSPYKQPKPKLLPGTRERHGVTFSRLTDIGYGLLHPPSIPNPKLRELAAQQGVAQPAKSVPATPRYVLGNWHEETPERGAFLGHLRALRVIHLPAWADALWRAGLDQHLIEPLPALGCRCWRLEGDLERWSALLSSGVQQGWLTAPAA
ncbi:MAG TPA: hypothetical protein VKT82_12150 [Ktedonobacterales bacterium]|nr:hypothetical protein [Ktedonobacterales bacterium]